MTDPLEQRFLRQTTICSDLTARIEATALQLLTRRIRTRYPQAKALILTTRGTTFIGSNVGGRT